jgi:uncharacterized protein (DUF2147 family)
MRPITLLLALALAMVPLIVSAASPEGHWKTIDDETGEAKSIVEVYEDDGTLYAKVVELLNRPEDEDVARCKECKGERKDQPIEGMVFLWGMERDGDVWSGGTILDPANGKTYDCKLWLDDGKLKVRGYVGIFYRTQEWLPVER